MNLPTLPSPRLFVFAAALLCLPVFLPAQTSDFAPGASSITSAAPDPLAPPTTSATADNAATLRGFTLGLRASYYRTSGLQVGPGIDADSEIVELSAPLTAHLGRQWRLNYTPTWRRYSNNLFNNTVNHHISLDGRTSYEAWTFGFAQSYTRAAYPLAETAEQTKFESFTTRLRADLALNSRLLWRSGVGYHTRHARDFTNYRDTHLEQALLWQSALPVVFGAGVTAGYLNINPGINQTYQRPELQLAWTISPVVELVARAGFESRQYRSGDAADLVNPLYLFDLFYTPFEHTRLALGVTRDVGVSFFRDQLVEQVTWRASLDQRLLGRLGLGLHATEHFADFIQVGPSATPIREDRRRSFTARLDYPFGDRLALAVVYRRFLQSSTAAGFNSSSTWYGIELSYQF